MNKKLLVAIIAGIGIIAFFLLSGEGTNDWEITNNPPPAGNIIAFGDSLTYGQGVDREDTYPAILSRRIGHKIMNKGVSGNTTTDGLNRLHRDVLSQNPSIVLVGLGGNDMLRRLSIDQQFENLRRIIDQIQQEGALVIVMGVEGDGFLFSGDYDERFEQLARETGSVYVPDILDGIIGRSSLMIDKIHPNAAGYEKMTDRIMNYAGDYLEMQ